MSRDPRIRARRHKAIQKIFEEGHLIEEQKDLVTLLAVQGFEVTQSSVSRDLRDLGAVRRHGRYELSGENLGRESFDRILDYIKGGLTIGDHMILLEVKRGSAGLVTSIIDDSGWADVAGTMASTDDKVLILTEDARRQANVLSRIPYAGAEED
jgi:transcriptional regulator of arginine metabolism